MLQCSYIVILKHCPFGMISAKSFYKSFVSKLIFSSPCVWLARSCLTLGWDFLLGSCGGHGQIFVTNNFRRVLLSTICSADYGMMRKKLWTVYSALCFTRQIWNFFSYAVSCFFSFTKSMFCGVPFTCWGRTMKIIGLRCNHVASINLGVNNKSFNYKEANLDGLREFVKLRVP